MECPYCKKEMKHGRVDSRNILYWTEKNKIESVSEESVRLSKWSLLSTSADAHYCADCRTVIVPVPEIEDPLDRLGRSWDEFTGRLRTAHETRTAQRAEEKQEKRREKRRKKDPWEME